MLFMSYSYCVSDIGYAYLDILAYFLIYAFRFIFLGTSRPMLFMTYAFCVSNDCKIIEGRSLPEIEVNLHSEHEHAPRLCTNLWAVIHCPVSGSTSIRRSHTKIRVQGSMHMTPNVTFHEMLLESQIFLFFLSSLLYETN